MLLWLRSSELFVGLVVVSVVRGLLCIVEADADADADDTNDNDGNAIVCVADWLECDDVSGITKSSLISRLLTPPPFVDSSDGVESWLLLNIVSNIRPTLAKGRKTERLATI